VSAHHRHGVRGADGAESAPGDPPPGPLDGLGVNSGLPLLLKHTAPRYRLHRAITRSLRIFKAKAYRTFARSGKGSRNSMIASTDTPIDSRAGGLVFRYIIAIL